VIRKSAFFLQSHPCQTNLSRFPLLLPLLLLLLLLLCFVFYLLLLSSSRKVKCRPPKSSMPLRACGQTCRTNRRPKIKEQVALASCSAPTNPPALACFSSFLRLLNISKEDRKRENDEKASTDLANRYVYPFPFVLFCFRLCCHRSGARALSGFETNRLDPSDQDKGGSRPRSIESIDRSTTTSCCRKKTRFFRSKQKTGKPSLFPY
jgi:hypothetical protein